MGLQIKGKLPRSLSLVRSLPAWRGHLFPAVFFGVSIPKGHSRSSSFRSCPFVAAASSLNLDPSHFLLDSARGGTDVAVSVQNLYANFPLDSFVFSYTKLPPRQLLGFRLRGGSVWIVWMEVRKKSHSEEERLWNEARKH